MSAAESRRRLEGLVWLGAPSEAIAHGSRHAANRNVPSPGRQHPLRVPGPPKWGPGIGIAKSSSSIPTQGPFSVTMLRAWKAGATALGAPYAGRVGAKPWSWRFVGDPGGHWRPNSALGGGSLVRSCQILPPCPYLSSASGISPRRSALQLRAPAHGVRPELIDST